MEFGGERITYLSDYADGEHDDFVTATVEDCKIIVTNRETHALKIHECAVAVKPQLEFLRRLPD